MALPFSPLSESESSILATWAPMPPPNQSALRLNPSPPPLRAQPLLLILQRALAARSGGPAAWLQGILEGGAKVGEAAELAMLRGAHRQPVVLDRVRRQLFTKSACPAKNHLGAD